MISTINVTTVTTVTAFASTTSLGVIGIAILLLLLMQKEFVATRSSLQSKTLGQVLNIAIMPLLVIFALIVVVKLAEILWMS
ncbi:MAG: hypothetical protein KJ077_00170 [Anaerolineae bacterium]|nr:hypothetical protein [Anaerolineae bacterium]